MSNSNDVKILNLKQQIEEKKKKLKNPKFNPVTNCILNFENTNYNLHTLQKQDLLNLLIKLNLYKMSITNLEIEEYVVAGYNILEWIEDCKNKLLIFNIKDEEKKLKNMEDKLSSMLSNKKKTELELSEIEKSLI